MPGRWNSEYSEPGGPKLPFWNWPWAARPSATAPTPTPFSPPKSSPSSPVRRAALSSKPPTTSRRRRPRIPPVEMSGALKTLAVSLIKIANDIRWLASGPHSGLGELNLPSLQPGSSIMPGKVNPVLPEILIQAAVQVIGNDTAVTIGGQAGFFELNTMLPLIASNLLQSVQMLSASVNLFAAKCVRGISANAERCGANIEKSPLLATYFAPYIGYDKAAALALKARETGRTVRELVLEEDLLSREEVDRIYRGIVGKP